ncbi:MAG: ABC transporter permease [Candidatus Omnitrophica bacterium]|nr:ABC transporter permease [Candidatus Omnitrophota bacterium]
MRFEFWLAKKYLTKREAKFLKLISIITILGVAIGVMALLVVIAVMSGFDQELESKILGINSDILVKADPVIFNPDEVMGILSGIDGVVAVSAIAVGNGSILKDGYLENIYFKGVELVKEKNATQLGKYMVNSLDDISQQGIVVGRVMADKLDLAAGSAVTVLLPFQMEMHDFVVEGIFESGMYEYDSSLVYINIDRARNILNITGATAIEVKIKNVYRAESVKKDIENMLGLPFNVLTWMDLNKNLFSALKLEKTAMFIILSLIILVASFNIASTLIMSVLEKVKDIGIMKAIGMKNSLVMKIFIVQGMLIGLSGIILGSVLGGIIIYTLENYPIIKLPSDIYYIDRLPVASSAADFILIIASALVITFISTLYPAIKASRFNPVTALRYE